VYGNQFAANHVPLTSGDNTITATAISADDYMATSQVTVSADTSGNYITLSSNLESGIVQQGVTPLVFTLKLAKTYTSPGCSFINVPDTVENMSDDGTLMEFKRRITDPGLYFITAHDVEVVDNVTSVPHSDTIAILAEDLTQFDTRLNETWSTMKSAFSSQDVPGALKNFSEAAQDKYGRILLTLSSRLPTMAATMQDIKPVSVTGNVAEYIINRMESINGQPKEISYFIYFIKDANGLWKIESY